MSFRVHAGTDNFGRLAEQMVEHAARTAAG
jgi:hypothetical protein